MNQIYLYKKIILLSCGILVLGSVFFVFVFDSFLYQLLFFIPSITISVLVYIIDKQTTIVENPTEIYAHTIDDEVKDVPSTDIDTTLDLFEKSTARIPRTKDISKLIPFALQTIASEMEMVLGVYYQKIQAEQTYVPLHTYAFPEDYTILNFQLGEGVIGQVALNKKLMQISEIPNDYPEVISGLGQAPPSEIICIPVCFNNDCVGVFELGFFYTLSELQLQKLESFVSTISKKIHD